MLAVGKSNVASCLSHSPEFSGGTAERRSFHFFRSRTAPQLAGYFISDFWNCLVPLCTHQQPAIRHAVVALASLHERFENNDNSILSSNYDIAQGGFALQQYNRAIGCLIKPITAGGQQALDVYLVACVLFACFEVRYSSIAIFMGSVTPRVAVPKILLNGFQALRGHYGSAISHVKNGVNIISSTKETFSPQATQSPSLVASTVSYVPLETLKVIFTRLDYQSTQVIPLQLQRVMY